MAEDLQPSFEIARDEKAFEDLDASRVGRRRSTWLYPDDGCFVRAVIAADTIGKSLNVKTAKIFAFGDLSVRTQNSPLGEVGWWYHVAAIAKVKEASGEKYYVYDPAIEPNKPIEVKEWLEAMNSPNAEVAICSGDAYDPDSDCAKGERNSYSRAQREATIYLDAEWYRLEALGRQPTRELGAFPPWL
jgi:hypothetical protein